MSIWLMGLVLVWVIGGSLFVCKILFPLETCEKVHIVKEHTINTSSQSQRSSIYMYNESLNIKKPYHKGFSFTVLFFGFIPALFREDWKYALIMFALSLVTAGLSNIYFAIKYNEIYIRELEEKGYIIMQ